MTFLETSYKYEVLGNVYILTGKGLNIRINKSTDGATECPGDRVPSNPVPRATEHPMVPGT